MSKVVELNDGNFTKEVKLSEKPIVLVDFSAEWCGPCQMLKPILEELAEEYDYVKVCHIDVDESPKITARYGILATPTLMVFRQGQIINIQMGYMEKQEIANMIM